MKLPTRAAAALIGWTLACSAWAAWPDKPIKLIVPAPAGGTMDIAARVIGQQLSTDTGQAVVVDNKPGAGGSIGIQAMLQAPADGYTLAMVASNVMAEIPHVIKMPFDPLKDIIPVASVARSGALLVTPVQVPAKNFKELIAYLKTRKGGFASYSPGTSSHYAGLILSDKAGLDMQHVAYPGSAPALQALLGGQVEFMFDGILTSTPMVKSGKMRAYAFTGSKRSRQFPDVPTVAELGYPDIVSEEWFGFYAPARTPADVIARANAVITGALRQRDVIDSFAALGLLAHGSSPEEMLADQRAELQRWKPLIKEIGFTLDS